MAIATISGQVKSPVSARMVLVGDVSWERMIRAVEKVRERLRRTVAALEAGGVLVSEEVRILGGIQLVQQAAA